MVTKRRGTADDRPLGPAGSRRGGNEAEICLAFADTYRMLNNRISIFTSLPLTSLDKISLQRRLDDIGKTKTDVTREKA